MRIEDFVKQYNLHDSFFKSVEKNESDRTITCFIEFAFWLQKDYNEGTPEKGIIKVVFHNVTEYSCEEGDPAGPFVGILKAECRDGAIIISLLDDETVSYFELIIFAEDVSVVCL